MGYGLLVFDFLASMAGIVVWITYAFSTDGAPLFRKPFHALRYAFAWITVALVARFAHYIFPGISEGPSRLFVKILCVAALIIVARFTLAMSVLIIGIASNALATSLNGLVMPVAPFEGVSEIIAKSDIHVLMDSGSLVPFLCDVIPAYVGSDLVAVYSIGDLLIYTGLNLMFIAVVRENTRLKATA